MSLIFKVRFTQIRFYKMLCIWLVKQLLSLFLKGEKDGIQDLRYLTFLHKTSSRCIGRGRSQTTLNKFCPLFTTYLSPNSFLLSRKICISLTFLIPTYLLTSFCQRSLRTPLNLHSEQALLNWILTWRTSYFRILQFFSSTSFAQQLELVLECDFNELRKLQNRHYTTYLLT